MRIAVPHLVTTALSMLWLTLTASSAAIAAPENAADACDADACAPHCADSPQNNALSDVTLTEAQYDVLREDLEAFREGPRPEGVGVCRGGEACSTTPLANPGTLGSGKHLLVATFRIPELGPYTWHFQVRQLCIIDPVHDPEKSGLSLDRIEKVFEVESRNTDVWTEVVSNFESPSERGHEACAWQVTATGPESVKTFEGEYEIRHVSEMAAKAERVVPPTDAAPQLEETDDTPAEGAAIEGVEPAEGAPTTE